MLVQRDDTLVVGSARGRADPLRKPQRVVAGQLRGAGHDFRRAAVVRRERDALEDKYYAMGVGNVLTVDRETGDRTELIRITTE